MIYLFPTLISLGQGFLLIRLLTRKADQPGLLWQSFAGCLLGLGLSGLLTFTSLLFLKEIVPAYVIGINLTALAILIGLSLKRGHIPFLNFPTEENKKVRVPFPEGVIAIILAALTIPTIIHAFLYPYGGWDAWSCWNLKARFLFLAGPEWTNMFDQAMWRSNTAYPLLLPLINVWSWCFGTEPTSWVPLANSCLITFLMAGLLYFSLNALNGLTWANLLAPAMILLNAFMLKLASSQYSDLLMGTFLLLAVTGFLLYQRTKTAGFLQTSAIALGLMSFTKSEGLPLSLITMMVLSVALALDHEDRKKISENIWKFIVTLTAAFLATGIFIFIYAPESHTYINGILSAEKPATMDRLAAVFIFLGRELASAKWNNLWFLMAAGIVFGWKRAFGKRLWIIPAIIIAYLIVIFGFYWVNTFFEIAWWLSTTLNRILFALAPTTILWIFLAIPSPPARGR